MWLPIDCDTGTLFLSLRKGSAVPGLGVVWADINSNQLENEFNRLVGTSTTKSFLVA
jgi:hypothetical protein